MTNRQNLLTTFALAALWSPALAQDKNDVKPLLRLEAGGPTSNVTSLAFSPDGKTLYVAGYDKVVRTWKLNKAGKFELDDADSFRVPIGPGIDGAINAIAVSDDGKWLAVGGFGVSGGHAMKFADGGFVMPTKGGLTAAMRQNRGLIFVYDVRDRSVKTLRGHTGPVMSLAFERGAVGAPRLISAAEGWDAAKSSDVGEVKIWNVGQEQETSGRTMPSLLKAFSRSPGLALFEREAMLAWVDGNVSTWRGNSFTVTPAAKSNSTLDVHPDDRLRFLTAGMSGDKGVLLESPGTTNARKFTFGRDGLGEKEFDFPATARYAGDKHVAAVVWRMKDGRPQQASLAIVDGNFTRQVATIPLGAASAILPTLAASRTHVAVDGFADHRVLVFAIDDLVAGKGTPQAIKSAGTTAHSVAFMKKGNDRGLLLNPNTKDNFVFDITNGKLKTDVAGWVNDQAPVGGDYRFVSGKQGAQLHLLKDRVERSFAMIALKEGFITATAVLPPHGQIDVPLIAIASYKTERGMTILELYDATTGLPIRSFAGHTAPIRGLSFRADGKLLASVSDDQTAAVWSLTDLDQVIGKHGTLGDFAVDQFGKDLTVVDAAGVPGINKNDVVRGLYDKAGQLKASSTPLAFYVAMWMKTPDQKAKLRISRGGAEQDVDVVVKQGTDVRKPLFSLFFPKTADGKLGDWLGWNNIGPFDSSRKEVEQYLGWHFNTGKADQPTSFAFIDQYRKEYFRPGILKEMAELGDLPGPPKPPQPKPAVLAPNVEVDGKLLTKVGGEYLLRKKAFDLRVSVPVYEPIAGDVLTYQVDSGPVLPLEQSDVNEWSAKVEAVGLEPTRRVTIRMKRTPEGWPAQEFRSDLALRIVAPPPKIAIDAPKEPIKVDKAEFAFKADFVPGDAGIVYRATVAQESLGRRIASKDLKSDKAGDLATKLTLEPGLNVIQVRAVNERAVGKPNEDEETATASVQVVYEPRKLPAPAIRFTRLFLDSGESTPIEGSVARIQGAKAAASLGFSLKTEEPVKSLEWDQGPGSKREPVADAKNPSIRVALKPGLQTVRVFLKTATYGETVAQQQIDFRPPPLGEPAIVNLEEGFELSGDAPKIESPLEVRFTAPPVDFKWPVKVEATVIGSGKTISQESKMIDAADGVARFDKLTLDHGPNTVRVRLTHDFGDDRVAEVHGRCVRPPKMGKLTAPLGKTPFVDVTAEVTSVEPPSADFVTVMVNGKAVRPAAIDVKKGAAEGTWTIVAKQTPIAATKGKAAKSDIAMSLMTSDGKAEASLKEPVVFALPLAPAPEITLLEPALSDVTLSEPTLKLRFLVRSDAPLTRVDLVRGNKTYKTWTDAQPISEGVYEFTLADVPLEWGVNGLGLSAWNEGGVRITSLNVNVPMQPVRLDLETAEIAPAGFKIKPLADGNFAPLPTGRVVLNGLVKWNSNEDARLEKAKQVRMFVNGFQQLPVEMKPVAGKERERKFQVPVVLNFADNVVEVDLPDLKQDAANKRKFSVGCLQPVRGQHLHVLVIAPQEKDEAKLVESLTRGIKASSIGSNLYKTPVFDVVRFYVLARHVQLLEVSSRLDRIAESLKERARAGNPNDLVMIYFQGKETVDANGPILWTSESAPWLQLTLKDLSKNYLSRFSGGQVLILDTVSKAGDIDFRGARFAYLRRPDPRALADASRPRLSTELEKQIPLVVWLDQLATVLAAQVRPTFQFDVPETLRNRIQLNPNLGPKSGS